MAQPKEDGFWAPLVVGSIQFLETWSLFCMLGNNEFSSLLQGTSPCNNTTNNDGGNCGNNKYCVS